MKVGDLVRRTPPAPSQGSGIVLDIRPIAGFAKILWTAHGVSKVHEVSTLYLEVINGK